MSVTDRSFSGNPFFSEGGEDLPVVIGHIPKRVVVSAHRAIEQSAVFHDNLELLVGVGQSIGDRAPFFHTMKHCVCVQIASQKEDLHSKVHHFSPTPASWARGVPLFFSRNEGFRPLSERSHRMGRMKRPNHTRSLKKEIGQNPDARGLGFRIEDRIVVSDLLPGVGRKDQHPFGDNIKQRVDHRISPAFDRADATHGCVRQQPVPWANADRFNICDQLVFFPEHSLPFFQPLLFSPYCTAVYQWSQAISHPFAFNRNKSEKPDFA